MILAGSMLVSLVSIEIILRLFFRAEILGSTMPLIYEPHKELGHVYKPGAVGFMKRHGEISSTIAINSEGFRDREFPYEKPAGTFRMAVLGDSYVAGNQVALEDTVPKVLETLLAERLNRKIEVLNFGVEGYGPREELYIFRRTVKRYNPDLVLLSVFPLNDVEDVQFGPITRLEYRGKILSFRHERDLDRLKAERDWEIKKERQDAEKAPFVSALRKHLWIFQFIEGRRFKSPEGVIEDLKPLNEQSLPEIDRTPDFYSPGFTHALETAKGLILDLRREVEDTGAAFAMVVAPADLEVSQKEWRAWGFTIKPDLFERAMHRGCALFHEFGMGKRIATLNLLPAFRAHYAEKRLYWTYDAHWTEAGHRLAAEMIAEFLIKEKLIT